MHRIEPTAIEDGHIEASRHRHVGVSSAGGHVGGKDVVGVPIEVLTGAVVAHGGAGVGVACRDLDVAEVDAGVEHGCDEGVPAHVGVHPGDGDAGLLGQPPQPAGGAVSVHSATSGGEQDRADGPASDGLFDGSAEADGSGTRTILSPLPCTRRTRWPFSSPRSSMLLPVPSKIRRPRRPSIATRAKSQSLLDARGGNRFELQMAQTWRRGLGRHRGTTDVLGR